METGSYLRIFRGRWRIIVFAGLVGMAAGFVTAPSRAGGSAAGTNPVAQAFTATHILVTDATAIGATAGRTDPAPNLELTALLATVGEVPARAAATLGISSPDALVSMISAIADAEVGALRITSTGTEGERVADVANGVAEALKEYLAEERAAQYQTGVAQAQLVVDDLVRQLGGVPAGDDPVLVAQRDGLRRRLETARDAQAALAAAGAPGAGLRTLQAARPIDATVTSPGNTSSSDRDRTTTTVTQVVAPSRSGESDTLARTFRVPIAGAMGLLLGTGLALLRERFDGRVRTRAMAESAFDLPVIAEIPRLRRQARRAVAPLVALDVDADLEAEPYRLLRSRVLQAGHTSLFVAAWVPDAGHGGLNRGPSANDHDASESAPGTARSDEPTRRWARAGGAEGASPGQDRPIHVLLVTSPASGDGKTAVSVNLAATVSETGTTALLLDLDFRRSDMARYFDAEPPPVGLSDLLESDEGLRLDDAVRSHLNSHLMVGLSGRSLTQPSAVMAALRDTVAAARHSAEVVILDAPPLLAVSEPSELVPSSDAVLVVCRLNATTVAAAARTSEVLAQLDARVLGVVVVGGASSAVASGYLRGRKGRSRAWRLRTRSRKRQRGQPSGDAHRGGEHTASRDRARRWSPRAGADAGRAR